MRFAQINARALKAGLSLDYAQQDHGPLRSIFHVRTVDHVDTGYAIEVVNRGRGRLYRARQDVYWCASERSNLSAALDDVLRHRRHCEREAALNAQREH